MDAHINVLRTLLEMHFSTAQRELRNASTFGVTQFPCVMRALPSPITLSCMHPANNCAWQTDGRSRSRDLLILFLTRATCIVFCMAFTYIYIIRNTHARVLKTRVRTVGVGALSLLLLSPFIPQAPSGELELDGGEMSSLLYAALD